MKVIMIITIVSIIGFLIAWRLIYVASVYDELIENSYKKFIEEVKNAGKIRGNSKASGSCKTR